MRAVDTNVLVRLLVRDDPAQADAAASFVAPAAWGSHLVLLETLWVLDVVHARTPAQLAAATELLLDHQSLKQQGADTGRAALGHFRARPSLGFSNCMVLATARKAGHLPLGTFDKAVTQLDGAVGL